MKKIFKFSGIRGEGFFLSHRITVWLYFKVWQSRIHIVHKDYLKPTFWDIRKKYTPEDYDV